MEFTQLIRQVVAGGYTDASGKPITLKPSTPKCEHSMTATAEKAATCTEDGNIAYWYCELCKKYFRDENGNSETTLAGTVIEATGHAFASEWSCDATYHWYAATCEHANIVDSKGEHSFGIDNMCTVCGKSNSPDPTKPDYVGVGDSVKEGDIVCLIEAMKTFNPVKAHRSGTVTKVLVESGDPVEYGESLLVIE